MMRNDYISVGNGQYTCGRGGITGTPQQWAETHLRGVDYYVNTSRKHYANNEMDSANACLSLAEYNMMMAMSVAQFGCGE